MRERSAKRVIAAVFAAGVAAAVAGVLLTGCAARRALPEDDPAELADSTPTRAELLQAERDALAALYESAKTPHAKWNGKRFVCPVGRNIWASEPEALAGHRDYVYCVKARTK